MGQYKDKYNQPERKHRILKKHEIEWQKKVDKKNERKNVITIITISASNQMEKIVYLCE